MLTLVAHDEPDQSDEHIRCHVVKVFSSEVLRFTIALSLQLQKILTICFKYSEYYNNQNYL